MSVRINLDQTVESVRWSDEPGSKEYRISFDDDHMAEMRRSLESLSERMRGIGDDDREAAAEAMRDFVVCVAGQECWDDAVAYVDQTGKGPAGCTVMLCGLVTGLADVVSDHLGHAMRGREAHYLRRGEDAL